MTRRRKQRQLAFLIFGLPRLVACLLLVGMAALLWYAATHA